MSNIPFDIGSPNVLLMNSSLIEMNELSIILLKLLKVPSLMLMFICLIALINRLRFNFLLNEITHIFKQIHGWLLTFEIFMKLNFRQVFIQTIIFNVNIRQKEKMSKAKIMCFCASKYVKCRCHKQLGPCNYSLCSSTSREKIWDPKF